MFSDFHLTLLSSNSIDKYPDNVLSVFTNYLENPISLAGKWEVGITEMFYNKFIHSLMFGHGCLNRDSLKNQIKKNYVESNPDIDLQCIELVSKQTWDMCFIHTDIMKVRPVGDQMVRCMKVFPADANKDSYLRFGRVEYYPVETTYIRSISIMIMDMESNPIEFHESSSPTLITLHFRPKRT